jgi:sugar (pentulose or hexulose) kinase
MFRNKFLLVALLAGIVPFGSALSSTMMLSPETSIKLASDEEAASVVGGCCLTDLPEVCGAGRECVAVNTYFASATGSSLTPVSCGGCDSVLGANGLECSFE